MRRATTPLINYHNATNTVRWRLNMITLITRDSLISVALGQHCLIQVPLVLIRIATDCAVARCQPVQ